MYRKSYTELLQGLNNGQRVGLVTYLNKDKEKKAILESDFQAADSNIRKLLEESFDKGRPVKEEDIIVEPFYPKPRLIIFGGGHIAKPLSQISHSVGFSITVVDDRPKFANPLAS